MRFKDGGKTMRKNKIAYCNQCEDSVTFHERSEKIEEQFKGKKIRYVFVVGRCDRCGAEVATDTDYTFRKSEARIVAYKRTL